MIRYLILAAALLIAPNTFGQTPFEYTQTQHCEGKYTQAADAIDAAHDLYGTLYSGGNDFSRRHDNLRGTINLYRAMQGFAPLDNSYDRPSHEIKPTAPNLTKALRLMTWPDPEMSAGDIRQYIILLDIFTSSGPADDWWLRVDDFKSAPNNRRGRRYYYYAYSEEDIELGTTHVTGAQRIVADFVRRHDELDWLQSAFILSNYDQPWIAADGRETPQDLANLFDHIEQKTLGGDHNRAWLSLLSLHKFYSREVPPSLSEIQNKIASDIENCTASPEHYAALIAGNYAVPDAAMPPKHLDLNLQLQARKIAIESHKVAINGAFLDGSFYAKISALKDRAHQKEKFALPLIFSAPNLTALEEAAQLKSRVTRPFLILSGRDLENISPGAAFTRHLTTNRMADAKRVFETSFAKHALMQTVQAEILESDLPDNIQMTMVALKMKELSHSTFNYGEHVHRDINPNYKSGDFLQEEFSSWLYPNGARYYFNHSGAYYLQHHLGSERYYPLKNRRRSQVRRRVRPLINSKSRYASDVPKVTAAIADPEIPSTGLLALADWDEFTAITDERRLTRALSLNVINWVRTAPAHPLMAEALHRVVRLNKHESGGALDGQPVDKLAFELLHQKFPNSEWAKKTPYWWP